MENPKKSPLKAAGPYINLGMQLTVGVILGMALGYFIDSKLHTLPVFLLIGLFVGATAGFLNIYRAVYQKKADGRKGRKGGNE